MQLSTHKILQGVLPTSMLHDASARRTSPQPGHSTDTWHLELLVSQAGHWPGPQTPGVSVCVCVCVHALVHVPANVMSGSVNTGICVHRCMCSFVCIPMCWHTHVMCAHDHMCMHLSQMYSCMYNHMYVHILIPTHMHTCARVVLCTLHAHVCMYTYVHVCAFAHI